MIIHKKCDNGFRFNQYSMLCNSIEPIQRKLSSIYFLKLGSIWQSRLMVERFISRRDLNLRLPRQNIVNALKHRREIAEHHGQGTRRITALATPRVTLITLACMSFTLSLSAAAERQLYDGMFITFVNFKICRIRGKNATSYKSNVNLN